MSDITGHFLLWILILFEEKLFNLFVLYAWMYFVVLD